MNAAWGGVTPIMRHLQHAKIQLLPVSHHPTATAADIWQIEAEGLNIRSPLLSLWFRQQIILAGCGFYIFTRDTVHPCLMRGRKTAGELGGNRKGTSYQLALN